MKMVSRKIIINLLLIILLFCHSNKLYAENDMMVDFTEFSIEELMEIEVTSVSKKPQKLSDAAAAIFVITQEDIRRSGVTNIMDALRMAPGLQVARIDANIYAISEVLTSGKWKEASKVAADAVGQVVLGVTDITDKIGQAAEAVTEFANDYVEQVTKATKAATALTQEQQRLRDQQRELNVEYAEARAEIEQLKQQRDDERLSIEDRIKAAERAAELDQQFAKERMDIANAEVALIEREIAIQGDSIERQDRLAEARIAAAEAAESSAAVQTELMTSIYGLNQESIAIEEEKIAKEQEAAEERKRLAEEERKQKEQDAKDELARNKELFDSRIAYATSALNALAQLNDAFSGDSEKEQERAFKRNKAIGIATAIVNTAGAIIGAINPAVGGLGIPAGLPGAAIAAATGAAQIATIMKSQFQGGSGSAPDAPSRTVEQPSPTTPQLDLGFLGGGAGQTGFRTYVVSSEVSNAQQANQRINDQASLVG